MNTHDVTPEAVIRAWMAAGPPKWFAKDAAFDDALRAAFGAANEAARAGQLEDWRASREGRLGLVILLDQISRNIHRGSALAFAGDALALMVAREAIAAGDLDHWPKEQAQWLILPFEHHEGLAEQDEAIALFERYGDADLVKWAQVHRDIIVMFGRFPHRNAVLGRVTTPEEQDFLAEGGFSG